MPLRVRGVEGEAQGGAGPEVEQGRVVELGRGAGVARLVADGGEQAYATLGEVGAAPHPAAARPADGVEPGFGPGHGLLLHHLGGGPVGQHGVADGGEA